MSDIVERLRTFADDVNEYATGISTKRAVELLTEDNAEMLAQVRSQLLTVSREREEARAKNSRGLCVWCGTEVPFPAEAPKMEQALAMWKHAEGCKERPEHRLAARIDGAIEKVEELRMVYPDHPVFDAVLSLLRGEQ